MIRSVSAVIAGLVVGGLVVGLIQLPGMVLHPLPADFDWKNSAAMKAHVESAPTALKSLVLLAWTVGPLVSSLVTCLIARRAFTTHGMIIGVIFMLLDLMNLSQFQHPWWMWVGGIIAPPLAAWLGAQLAARVAPPRVTGPRTYDMREKNMAC